MQINLVWAYAKLAHYHSDLVAAVADAVADQLQEMKLGHIKKVLHAFATLNAPMARMGAALVKEVAERLGSGSLAVKQAR